MARVNLHKAILLYLGWLAFISGTLIVTLSDLLPVKLSFVRPDNLFTCLVEAELFFVLVIWPLSIPRILQEEAATPAPRPGSGQAPEPARGEVHVLLLQVVVLIVFVLPLAFICQNIANLGLWAFFKGQLMVAVLAAFVAALFEIGVERRLKLAPWYYLAFFVVAALLPFLHFLSVEYRNSHALGLFGYVSPFWAAGEIDPGGAFDKSLAISAIFGAATVGLLVGAPFFRKSRATAA